MKAVILAGGRGKRLKETTNSSNKCMLEVDNKPVLEYNLDRALEMDIDEIVMVVGYRAEDIINRYGTSRNGVRIRYVIQWEQKGLVHAIECSKDAIERDDFFLLLGDEVLINSRHKEMIREFIDSGLFTACGVCVQQDKSKIGRTYAVLANDEDRVFRLIEKPKKLFNSLQGTGNCIFKNEILRYIERTPIHPERGEKELPDLIQCAVDDGQLVKIFHICDAYTNVNSIEDLKEAEQILKA
ncbi:MAG: nucleotidyltransferase family protein [Halobacteriota archaeon]